MVRAYPGVSDSVYFRWDLKLFIFIKDVDDACAFPLRTRDCSAVVPRSPGLSECSSTGSLSS